MVSCLLPDRGPRPAVPASCSGLPARERLGEGRGGLALARGFAVPDEVVFSGSRPIAFRPAPVIMSAMRSPSGASRPPSE